MPRFTLLAVVLSLAPLSAAAQESSADTSRSNATPFRRGQWGAQFQLGSSGSNSLGFLKFQSPTRALVLDLRLGGSHSEASRSDTAGTEFIGLSSDATTQLRFGWRRYHGASSNLASHYTFGVLAGFDHHVGRTPLGSNQANGWTAGVFGDIGGTYLVTPHLGLGAIATVSLAYTRSVSEGQPGNLKYRTWGISGSAISTALVVALFF